MLCQQSVQQSATLQSVRAVDTRQLGVAAVGRGRQVALESREAAAVGREPVAQPSSAQVAAGPAQRIFADAARARKVWEPLPVPDVP